MARFQAEEMHEKRYRKVSTLGEASRKVNNIDRMKMTTRGNSINRKKKEEHVAGPMSTAADDAILS